MSSGTTIRSNAQSPTRFTGWRAFLALAAMSALVLAACGQEDPTFRPDGGNTVQTGSIAVTSSAPGAVITLDGDATGHTTPDTLQEVSLGAHQVRVFLGGYTPDPAEHELVVEADSVHNVHFDMALVQGAGAIAIEAPYPAAIFLDGVATGLAAPDTVEGVASGEHTVTLDLPGFRSDPEEIRVTVLADLVVPASFDLAVPKMVVCEDFSNYGCIPCVPADAALREALAQFDEEQAISLNPHLNFPTRGDPFYQFNPQANEARGGLFQVLQMPAIFANGTRIQDPRSTEAIRSSVEAQLAVSTPLAIGVRAALGSKDLRITVDVWGVESGIPSNLFLFTCIVETAVTLEPPGPNGLSEYRNVLRHFFPAPEASGDLGGEALGPLQSGARRTFQYTYPLSAEVDPVRLGVIAFAQERAGDRRVIQTGTSFSP